jgi:hypothetical protein
VLAAGENDRPDLARMALEGDTTRPRRRTPEPDGLSSDADATCLPSSENATVYGVGMALERGVTGSRHWIPEANSFVV